MKKLTEIFHLLVLLQMFVIVRTGPWGQSQKLKQLTSLPYVRAKDPNTCTSICCSPRNVYAGSRVAIIRTRHQYVQCRHSKLRRSYCAKYLSPDVCFNSLFSFFDESPCLYCGLWVIYAAAAKKGNIEHSQKRVLKCIECVFLEITVNTFNILEVE